MSTFTDLVTALAVDLRDPSNKTFTTTMLGNFITEALVEVGRLAPARFQQDITPLANTLIYSLHSTGDPEIELSRVEVWDITFTPDRFVTVLVPSSGEHVDESSTGWRVWNGSLYLSNGQEDWIDPAIHLIRVWGWAPYPVVSGSTAMPVSTELEWAVRLRARLLGLYSLLASRNVYSQWQGQSNNTDITPANIMSQIAQSEDEWRRRSRAITILRSAN